MDDVCAACRTEEGVDHECQECGFSFCEPHSSPADHNCPAVDHHATADVGQGSATGADTDAGARAAAASAASTARDATTTARSALSSRAAAARNATRNAVATVRDRLDSWRSTGGTGEGKRVGSTDDADRGGPADRAGAALSSTSERARTAIGRASAAIRRAVGRGRKRLPGTGSVVPGGQLGSIAVVVVLLVAASAVVLGTSGLAVGVLDDGGDAGTDAATNEMVTDGADDASLADEPAAFETALRNEINAARADDDALADDEDLGAIAANHSAAMADAESADLAAWDEDRIADRLAATNHSCETFGQTGAWIDPGDESDPDTAAATTVDRWLDDDEFSSFLRSSEHDLAAISATEGDDGRLYVSVTACGR